MDLARVVGRVVCTQKDQGFNARTLLLIQPVDEHDRTHGKPFIAVDAIGAGAGERVFYVTGKEASFTFLPDHVPTDASIVAIVDQVDLLEP